MRSWVHYLPAELFCCLGYPLPPFHQMPHPVGYEAGGFFVPGYKPKLEERQNWARRSIEQSGERERDDRRPLLLPGLWLSVERQSGSAHTRCGAGVAATPLLHFRALTTRKEKPSHGVLKDAAADGFNQSHPSSRWVQSLRLLQKTPHIPFSENHRGLVPSQNGFGRTNVQHVHCVIGSWWLHWSAVGAGE